MPSTGPEPAGERHRAGTLVQVGCPLLECSHCGVHDAGTGIPVVLQVEVRSGSFRVLEHVVGGLVNG